MLLSCLREGPAHGYLVTQRLRERSHGEFELLEGTLYPALHRLEAAGAASSKWSSESGRRRRVYQLTRKGSVALTSRENEWRQFTSTVNHVLGGAS